MPLTILVAGKEADLRTQFTTDWGLSDRDEVTIEIPTQVDAFQNEKTNLIIEWRHALRHAFVDSMRLKFVVEEFYRDSDGEKSVGRYLLRR